MDLDNYKLINWITPFLLIGAYFLFVLAIRFYFERPQLFFLPGLGAASLLAISVLLIARRPQAPPSPATSKWNWVKFLLLVLGAGALMVLLGIGTLLIILSGQTPD